MCCIESRGLFDLMNLAVMVLEYALARRLE